MHRPQFSLKTLLWLMVVVAAFLAGIQFERQTLTDKALLDEVERRSLLGTIIKSTPDEKRTSWWWPWAR